MKMHAGFALVVLAAVAALPAAAQEVVPDPQNAEERVSIAPSYVRISDIAPVAPGDCTPGNTIDAGLEDVLKDPGKYRGRCISTLGYFEGAVFAPKRETVEKLARTYPIEESWGALYGSDEIMREISASGATRARIVGKVWDYYCLVSAKTNDTSEQCKPERTFIGVASFHPLR